MKGSRTALTVQRIAAATCAPGKAQALLWDAVQPGLVVRVYPTGKKTYVARYRPAGGGRAATPRWLTIGDVASLSLKDARDAARVALGAVAKGGDPAAERKAAHRRDRARLEPAIERYEAELERRNVVRRREVVSLLRRELLGPMGNVDLAELGRPALVDRVNAVEKSGRPGTAKELRMRAGVFFGWAVEQGLMPGNPLAGWRRPRRTRAERLEQPGRALADAEISAFWRAADAQGWPFGPYLKTLLLTGQRRTETAMMRWEDVDLAGGEWNIPAAVTKSGRAHRVPLPAELGAMLGALPRLARCPYVFPGRRATALTGWSKRLPPVYAMTAAAGVPPWTLHDLRRTARTGLSALGVDPVTAELMLNHGLGDELAKIYDRHDAWQRRVDAAARWARHVAGLVTAPPGGNVVQFPAAR